VRGFGGGCEAAYGDSGRKHEKSQQYLAQSQDKDGNQGENIQVVHHVDSPVLLRDLEFHEGMFK